MNKQKNSSIQFKTKGIGNDSTKYQIVNRENKKSKRKVCIDNKIS